ncbi:MAG: glycosyltransferase [Chitinophagales bacterium]
MNKSIQKGLINQVPDKHLHIICLDVPFPPDYGGIIDIFYKIKALSEHGILIHLHCFEYGRGEQTELNKYCQDVNYYSRSCGHKGISHKLPYIVCSRVDEKLAGQLLLDEYPILLEGVHCSFLLADPRFKKRKVILRLHNTEYEYYRQLFFAERSLAKKMYYWHESRMLKSYERKISNAVCILALAERDVMRYKSEFSAGNISYLPVFLPSMEITSRQGNGCYCLYHGNLSVSENEKAAIWLLENVFNDLQIPLVIAGKNPSARLERSSRQHPQCCLVSDPSEEEMQDIIAKAQIHVIPSFNATGIKLKLLNALFNGRHCVVNEEAVRDTRLEKLCHVGTDAREFKKMIIELFDRPFSSDEIGRRAEILHQEYDNQKNAGRLIQWLW